MKTDKYFNVNVNSLDREYKENVMFDFSVKINITKKHRSPLKCLERISKAFKSN